MTTINNHASVGVDLMLPEQTQTHNSACQVGTILSLSPSTVTSAGGRRLSLCFLRWSPAQCPATSCQQPLCVPLGARTFSRMGQTPETVGNGRSRGYLRGAALLSAGQRRRPVSSGPPAWCQYPLLLGIFSFFAVFSSPFLTLSI